MRKARLAVENAELFLSQSKSGISQTAQLLESVPSNRIHGADSFFAHIGNEPLGKRARFNEEGLNQPTNANQQVHGEVPMTNGTTDGMTGNVTNGMTKGSGMKHNFEIFHCNLNGFKTNVARAVAAIRLREKKHACSFPQRDQNGCCGQSLRFRRIYKNIQGG